ncbi:MAG: AmmeMemoRadiSam system protein B [Acidobacteriia bacterium]|nr:AmmeMemoRadiSam system protein B [Terriglobia bacterium]
MGAIHISPFAGSWYPEHRSELERLLAERFGQSRQRTGPFLRPGGLAFVMPHAGPAYSGTVASAVYRAVEHQKPEQIVLLAFPHRGFLKGVVTPDVEAISTPLGEVAIDRAFAREFRTVPEARVCDHSFEIQLPYLQMTVPGARVTPLYVGEMTAGERGAAADVLAAAWRPGVVFLASSDFTHYGPRFEHVPFAADRNTAERLRELDFEYIEAAGSLDSSRFLDTLRQHKATVCGASPIALLLDTLERLGGEEIYQSTLDYQTSGDLTGDWEDSVSYAALGYYRRQAFELDETDREALLDSAAETLRRLREEGSLEAIPARGGSVALTARCGAFVSLHQGEELLGCIGNLLGRGPLVEEVAQLALAAALDDPRFRQAASVQGPIDIEISVLTPFRWIRGAEEFSVGKHGALLKLGKHAGLLLPQVAEGRDWTAEDFLRAVARKSNLGPSAWRDPRARLSVFEAQIFARKNIPPKMHTVPSPSPSKAKS